ncbi:MAG: hypothetical protein WCQ77_11955 [Planctomycetota bacterium]
MTPSTTMPQPQLPRAHAAACWLPVVLWFCGMSIGRAQGNAVIINIPKPVVLPGDAVQRLLGVVAQRTNFFQAQKFAEGGRQHDYFAAEKLWQERQPLIRPLNRDLKEAQLWVNRADLQVQRNRNLATGHAGRGMERDVAAAEQNLKAAKAKRDQIQGRRNAFLIGQIQPLENYLQGARPKWAEIYSQMAQLVPRDATDPLAKAVADAWDAAGANENDFVEADVLGAVSKIYAGDQVSAEKLLQRASNFLKASQLYGLPVAVDCCHGWLLLGKPPMCQDYVTFLKNLPDTATVIGQDWAIGLHAYADRKLNGGTDDFSRAVRKAIKLRALAQEAPPALWGDAVVSLLQTDEVDAGRGRNFFKTAGPVVVSDGCWQVLRARAMIAADAADWKPAVALLEVCAERAPGAMQAELADHLAAYRQQQVWNVCDWARVAAAGVPVAPVLAPQVPPPPLALAGDDADPRYTYDGTFPRSDFRIRFDELRNQTDIASVMRWREVLRAVFASGLTLNETDWAEHCLDSNEPAESLDSDETIRLQKYVELTADGA